MFLSFSILLRFVFLKYRKAKEEKETDVFLFSFISSFCMMKKGLKEMCNCFSLPFLLFVILKDLDGGKGTGKGKQEIVLRIDVFPLLHFYFP